MQTKTIALECRLGFGPAHKGVPGFLGQALPGLPDDLVKALEVICASAGVVATGVFQFQPTWIPVVLLNFLTEFGVQIMQFYRERAVPLSTWNVSKEPARRVRRHVDTVAL